MRIAPRCVLAAAILAMSCFGQQSTSEKPRISDQSLTAEELAVYHGLLSSWFGKERIKISLATLTDPLPQSGPFGYEKTCIKDVDLEPIQAGTVHQIQTNDLLALGPGEIRLVDPETGSKEVSQNDPGNAIREGKPVDVAVDNGFAHALFTLSEIRFSKDHARAVVSFSFVCGGLCGNGGTMVMAKLKDRTWKRIRSCGGWVS